MTMCGGKGSLSCPRGPDSQGGPEKGDIMIPLGRRCPADREELNALGELCFSTHNLGSSKAYLIPDQDGIGGLGGLDRSRGCWWVCHLPGVRAGFAPEEAEALGPEFPTP